MISVLPIKDENKIREIYDKENVVYSLGCGLVSASDEKEIYGYGLYKIEGIKTTVFKISAENPAMFDGILRSTLHVGVTAGVTEAYYTDTADESMLGKLGFIASYEEKELNINKLFESCCSCGNKNT